MEFSIVGKLSGNVQEFKNTNGTILKFGVGELGAEHKLEWHNFFIRKESKTGIFLSKNSSKVDVVKVTGSVKEAYEDKKTVYRMLVNEVKVVTWKPQATASNTAVDDMSVEDIPEEAYTSPIVEPQVQPVITTYQQQTQSTPVMQPIQKDNDMAQFYPKEEEFPGIVNVHSESLEDQAFMQVF